jgi:plasmid stability protein
MATINIENFDDELYEALRKRAETRGTSFGAVLTELVKQHIPTESELAARHTYFERLSKIHAKPMPEGVKFKSTEDMLHEDRDR